MLEKMLVRRDDARIRRERLREILDAVQQYSLINEFDIILQRGQVNVRVDVKERELVIIRERLVEGIRSSIGDHRQSTCSTWITIEALNCLRT
jgi:hypothetical protein